MKISSPEWRGFLQHLGPYLIVNTTLAIVNVLITPDPTAFVPWFLIPTLAWGIGLGIHFWRVVLSTTAPDMRGKWRGFLEHLGSYLVVIGVLAAINLLITPSFFWFLFPAAAWGVGLAIHFWKALFSEDDERKVAGKRRAVRKRGKVQQRSTADYDAARSYHQLANSAVQAHLVKARAYKEQINSMIDLTSDEVANTRLQDLACQVDEWTQAVEDLAWRVDRFQQDPLIRQDLESVPNYIAELEARLAREKDEATRTDLQRTLINRKNQLTSLERLRNMMSRAEIQIESTLSALGTIYSQILTSQSTNQVADYSRLSTEVDEEVQILQDHLEALEEVKLARG